MDKNKEKEIKKIIAIEKMFGNYKPERCIQNIKIFCNKSVLYQPSISMADKEFLQAFYKTCCGTCQNKNTKKCKIEYLIWKRIN
jgi:hypothetical protein